MRADRVVNALIALILSFILAIGVIGCIVSAFQFDVDFGRLMSILSLCALLHVMLYYFRWGTPVIVLFSLVILIISLFRSDLLLSIEKILNTITMKYNLGYGWGYIRWSATQDLVYAQPDNGFVLLGWVIISAVSGTIVGRKVSFGALLAAVLPLASCFVLINTVPDTTFLSITVCALLLLILSNRSRRMDLKSANRITALLLIPVMLFTNVVFTYAPNYPYQGKADALMQEFLDFVESIRIPGDMTTPTAPTGSGITLSPDTVNLADAGPSNLGTETVMTVKTSNRSLLYLRGRSYSHYTGTHWESRLQTKGEGGWYNGRPIKRHTLTVKTSHIANLMYFPYYVKDASWTDGMDYGAIPNPSHLKAYHFTYLVPRKADGLVEIAPLSEDDRLEYLSLPDETRTAAAEILAQFQLLGSIEETANFIEDYVRQIATYDTNTTAMPSDQTDFAIWFLTEAETGYCIHFATAATVLLRAAGIPARYVTGYVTPVQANQDTDVRADQAHAWVEYLHPEMGWTVLEATPMDLRAPEPPTEPPTTEPTIPSTEPTTEPTIPGTEPTTEPTIPGTEPTIPTGGETKPTIQTKPTQEPTDPSTTIPVENPGTNDPKPIPVNLKWIRGILAVLLIWALIAGIYRLRLWLRRKLHHQGNTNRQALRRWRFSCLISWLSGHSAGTLLPIAEKAAFSQYEISDEELAQFDLWMEEANQALLKKPWLWQFLLRLLFAIP